MNSDPSSSKVLVSRLCVYLEKEFTSKSRNPCHRVLEPTYQKTKLFPNELSIVYHIEANKHHLDFTITCIANINKAVRIVLTKMNSNSAEPDQTAPKEQSDLALHCLLISN